MQKQKGITSVIFIIIIIAFFAIAGFYAYKYYSVPKTNTTPAPQTQNQQNQNQKTEKENQITVQQNNTTVKPLIKVLSPNGGEVFKRGDNIVVKWMSENVEKVYVRTWYYDADGRIGVPDGQNYSFNEGQCRITYDPVLASLGSYTIKDGDTGRCGILSAGDRIKIEIIAHDSSVKDTSDNYFSIIK